MMKLKRYYDVYDVYVKKWKPN